LEEESSLGLGMPLFYRCERCRRGGEEEKSLGLVMTERGEGRRLPWASGLVMTVTGERGGGGDLSWPRYALKRRGGRRGRTSLLLFSS